ncbi:MAG: hypothetical protein IPJ60_14395 [Sphingobacteriaceae bacterium]|nr:hypothetical protein [Sphingobacteriaceae bacterium]
MIYQKMSKSCRRHQPLLCSIVQKYGTIPTAAGNMFWADTKEDIKSFKISISKQIDFEKVKNELKIGGMYQVRNRTFDVRNLGFSRYRISSSKPFESSLLLLPEDSIFDPKNLGVLENGKGGFKLDEASKVTDSLQSWLITLRRVYDRHRIFEKLRVVGGLRLESYYQKLEYSEMIDEVLNRH